MQQLEKDETDMNTVAQQIWCYEAMKNSFRLTFLQTIFTNQNFKSTFLILDL